MSAAATARDVRRGAGLFESLSREVVAVRGSDRVRWLNGMISNDVAALAPGPERSGCYATLLTARGRIVADLQVLLRDDAFWLDAASDAAAGVIATLSKYVIADDVTLERRGDTLARMAIEGPRARAVVESAIGAAVALADDACTDAEIDGRAVVLAAFGWTGEPALQVFAEREHATAVADALRAAGAEHGLVSADAETLEILRIEAGTPRFGAELDESVLPAEAGLERAVSRSKGCYTGQEVVERLRSQGQVSHRLVGLVTDDAVPFEPGDAVEREGRRVGEVTSACVSPQAGAIALAYLRRAQSEPGTAVNVGGRDATVASLPFVAASPIA